MYIRIQDNTIRYRVSKTEADLLICNETLYDSLDLTEKNQLSYSISCINRHSYFSFCPDNNLMSLQICKEELLKELADRPSKNGIEVKKILSEDKLISVFLEIDIKRTKK